MLFSAIFDMEVADHFVDVADFYFFLLWQGRVEHASKLDSVKVVRLPVGVAGCAIVQHPLNVSEVFRR